MTKSVILCVDDEKVVLNSLKTQLKRAFGNAYQYEMAEDATDALEVIQDLHQDNVSVLIVVSDWLMPGMKGDEFLLHVHQLFPHIIKVLLTGQADQRAIARARSEANLYRCLFKPWSEAELVQTIQAALV